VKAIVSPNCRIRYPELFVAGDDSIVDDYCYVSVRMHIGRCVHIGAQCLIAGGKDRTLTLSDFSGMAAGVKVYCRSDDFVHDLAGIFPDGMQPPAKTHYIEGDVTFGEYATIGANSVVMPDNELPEGVAIGALSFVPQRFRFEPWTVYTGNPIRKLMARDRANVLRQAERIREFLAQRGRS